jgi:hypothetical protein
MGERERLKKGVPILRITKAGRLYEVRLTNGDWLFINEVEKKTLDSLKEGESMGVRDMGRPFVLWRERRGVLVYKKALE